MTSKLLNPIIIELNEAAPMTLLQAETVTRVSLRDLAQQAMVRDQAMQAAYAQTIHQTNQMLSLHVTLNVNAIARGFELTQYMRGTETRQQLMRNAVPFPEEERFKTRNPLYVKQVAERQQLRRSTLKRKIDLLDIDDYAFAPSTVIRTEHQTLCLLENTLLRQNPVLVPQIIAQIVRLSMSRAKDIPIIEGAEALQKAMLQYLVAMYFEAPYTVNMASIRITPLTKEALEEYPLVYYMCGVMQAQELKCKPMIYPALLRRQETKQVAQSKSGVAAVPLKIGMGERKKIGDDPKFGTPPAGDYKEAMWLSLRYAYSMPFFLRKMIAEQTGMPENHKFAGYFNINGIVNRVSSYARLRSKYPEARYLTYSADKNVMKAIMRYRFHSKEGYVPKQGRTVYRRRKYYKFP